MTEEEAPAMRMTMRAGMFETNSSGTHCFTYMDDSELQAFLEGEFFLSADKDFAEGRRIGEDEFNERRSRYASESANASWNDYWYGYSAEEFADFFPVECDVVDGRRLAEGEPICGAMRSWISNYYAKEGKDYIGRITMNAFEDMQDGLECGKHRYDIEIYLY